MAAPRVRVRAYDPASDTAWAEELLETEFAGRLQARRGELMDPLEGEGLVADIDGGPVGLLTWFTRHSAAGPPDIEIRGFVVEAESRGRGVGSALLGEAVAVLGAAGAASAWLVTTNDNLEALAFYQRRGWRLVGLFPGAVDEARRSLKPGIGAVAENGIPIRDELILAIELTAE